MFCCLMPAQFMKAIVNNISLSMTAFFSDGYNISYLRLGLSNATGPTVTFGDSFKVSKFILDSYELSKSSFDYGQSGECHG